MRIKLLSIGEPNVGKSCLIKRYCEQKFFARYIPTIGVDFGVRTVPVEQREVKVNFWDLSGDSEYLQIRNEFYADTQAALFVFDVTDKATFDALGKWLQEAQSLGCKPVASVLCGNKSDGKRAVSEATAKAFAEANNLIYFETSAQTGQNVNEMFATMFNSVVRAVASRS